MRAIRYVLFRFLSVLRFSRADANQNDAPRWAPDSWWLDVKLGIRMLIKYPGLALSGGAGIAVVVAITAGAYSFIYTNVMVSSLPLEEGDRVVSIEIWDAAAGRPEQRSLYDYNDWREGLKSVQEVSAFRTLAPNLIVPGARPESVLVASMSASGFRVARVQPLIGRYVQEEDEREGAASVVVIGETIWRNRFAADPAILGRTIRVSVRAIGDGLGARHTRVHPSLRRPADRSDAPTGS